MLRKVFALSILAMAFVVPTFAQSKDNSSIKAEVEKHVKAYEDAVNKKDAAGIASLLAQQIVYVPVTGQTIEGRDNVRKFVEQGLKNLSGTVKISAEKILPIGSDAATAVGNTVVMTADNKELKSHWGATYIHEGGRLKSTMITIGPNAAAPMGTQQPQK